MYYGQYTQTRKNPEEEEQITLMEWAELQKGRYPELALLYHVPNGGARAKTTAARLKAAGVKAGVPDLCLPVARGGFHGLYIELKTGTNKTTERQNQWLDALSRQGYKTAVCYGWVEASQTIKDYLTLRMGDEKRHDER